jgi:general secretion pathway protein D
MPETGAPLPDARVNGLIVGDKTSDKDGLVAMGGGTALGRSSAQGSAAAGPADVTLTFVDTDIREIVRTVLGGILKVNYTIDPGVHGSATLETPIPLTRAELLPALSTLLGQNGAVLVKRSGLYQVVPASTAGGGVPAVSEPGADTAGAEIVPLRYASATQLAQVLQPYAVDTAKITADPARNALLVRGDGAGRASLVALIKAFDVDVLVGQSYALFPVASGEPSKAAAELQKVLQTDGDGRLAGAVRVVAMERANAVMVIAQQPRYIEVVRRIYRLLKEAENVTARSWHIYYVRNGDAADLENLLQRAFTPGHVSASPSGKTGSTAPGFDTTTLNSSASPSQTGGGAGSSAFGSVSGGSTGGIGQAAPGNGATGGNSPSPSTQDRSPSDDSLSAPTGADSGGDAKNTANTMRIIANRRSNALLIFSTPEEYSTVDAMLAKVDVLPLQVMIEATIAEVTLNDNLQYGTQFFFENGGLNGTLSQGTGAVTTTGPSTFGGTYPAFVLNKVTGAVHATLSALQSVTEVKVLSSPQILVLDNETAQLVVGDQVPVITQSANYTGGVAGSTVNSVDYRSTGVILQVMPKVNSGGLVTLDISQEVSDVVTTTSSTIDSPTFQERKVKSRVVVQDGQTVGLAGLIRDTASVGNSGIPYLKDIPILGTLLSNQDNTRQRTELLILLTPRVVQDQRQARALTEDLRARLRNSDYVPAEKAAQKPSGSAYPNAFVDK